MQKKFVIATNNAHKLREFRQIFAELGLEVISMKEAGVSVDPEENGTTFAENAMIKAKAVFDICSLPTVADDSGLCVDALDGAPGVYSARYGGEGLNDAERRALLLKNLAGKPSRDAHFTSAIACVMAQDDAFVVEGHCFGKITLEEHGDGGFGYDALFLPKGYTETFGQLPADEKNKISHRGNGLQLLANKLNHPVREIHCYIAIKLLETIFIDA